MKSPWTLLLPAALAAAQSGNNTPYGGQKGEDGNFVIPPNGVTAPSDYPNNPTYKNGQQLNVTWVSQMPVVDIFLYQLLPNDTYVNDRLSLGITGSNYNWVVTNQVLNPGVIAPNMYFFLVSNASNTNTYFTSHFFNVTDDSDDSDSPATTATATASASVLNGTGIGPDVQAATATPSSSPTSLGPGSGSDGQLVNNAAPSKSVVSGGAIAGVVIGVVAVVVFLAAAVWFLCAAKRKRAQAQATRRAGDAVVDAAATTDAHKTMPGELCGKSHLGTVEAPDTSNYSATPELPSPQYHALTAELPSRGYHGNAPVEVEAKPVCRR